MVSEVTELIEAAEEAESPESSPLTESGFDSSGLDSQES